MKLFYSPAACSLGIHVILEDIGAPYELHLINLRERQQLMPEFRAVNPKGKVPALLRDDNTVVTEYPAIAFWLARRHSETKLIGEAFEEQARALELIDHIVSTIHMRGYTLAMHPQKFVSDAAAQEELRKAGCAIFEEGLQTLSERLDGQNWFLGEYSIADPTAYYLLNWARREAFPLAENLVEFLARMEARPSVRAARAQEGLD
jgi:glutathione S-transferase